jgi:hypothetical protein
MFKRGLGHGLIFNPLHGPAVGGGSVRFWTGPTIQNCIATISCRTARVWDMSCSHTVLVVIFSFPELAGADRPEPKVPPSLGRTRHATPATRRDTRTPHRFPANTAMEAAGVPAQA